MTDRPTARRFTGTPPTLAVRFGDAPFPSLLADRGRDLEALPQRMVRLGDGPYRLPGQEGSPVVSLRFHHSHSGRNPAKPNSANKTTSVQEPSLGCRARRGDLEAAT